MIPIEIDPNGSAFYYIYLLVMASITLIGTVTARNKRRAGQRSTTTVPAVEEVHEGWLIGLVSPIFSEIENIREAKLTLQVNKHYILIHIVDESDKQT